MNYDEKLYKSAFLLYSIRLDFRNKRQVVRRLRQAKRLLPNHLAKHITRELIKDAKYDGRAVRDDEKIGYDILFNMVNYRNLSYMFLEQLKREFVKKDNFFVYVVDIAKDKKELQELKENAKKYLTKELKQELKELLNKGESFENNLYDFKERIFQNENEIVGTNLYDFLHELSDFITKQQGSLERFLEKINKVINTKQ